MTNSFFDDNYESGTVMTPEELLAFQWNDFSQVLFALGDWIGVHAAGQSSMIAELVELYNEIGGTTNQYLVANERLNALLTEARLYQETKRAVLFGLQNPFDA